MPKLSLKFARKALVLLFVLSLVFGGGYYFGRQGYVADVARGQKVILDRQTPPDKGELDFSLFWRVWDTLSEKYFDRSRLVESKMVYGAIHGMVAALDDPYTVFLPPSENKVVQEDLQGSFSGVGIQIGFKGTQLVVIAPLEGSPAEAAGIRAGDMIVGIKDEVKGVDRGTVGITLPEAVQIIRGPAGSKIALSLIRDGESELLVKEVVREEIDVPSLVLNFVGDNGHIAHIKLVKFAAETMQEWEGIVLAVLKNPNVDSIVFDVRNNPGGYLQGAVDLAGDFVDNDSVVVLEELVDGERNEYRTDKLPRLKDYKMVILINEGSASASEIFAGAMRDLEGTKLVGETSFGKGTIQEPQQLDGGAGFHITIAKWLTPRGIWVNDVGLKPDIEVENNLDTPEDEQLERAISLLEG